MEDQEGGGEEMKKQRVNKQTLRQTAMTANKPYDTKD